MNSTDGKFSFGEDYSKVAGEMTNLYLKHFMETIQKFIENLDMKEEEVFTFGDFGALDGFSSVNMIARIADLLKRKMSCDVPVNVIYEDLHSNNFNYLVKTLNRHRLMGKQNLFMSMCPVGFYEQCQPINTFHVITSTFAVHFLSGTVSYKNSLYKYPDATPEETKAAEKQASADWIKFLSLRAKEMKSGAIMMLTMPVEDKKNCKVHQAGLWDLMTALWRQMKEEELITIMEYESANYQGYYRTEEELRAPFREGSTVHSAGLYIQSMDIVHQHNHSNLSLADNNRTEVEKQATWAHSVTETVREWTEYIFLEALDQRKAAPRREIVDTFYTRLVDKLKCEDREDSGWENIICYLVIRKS